jgi:hypothetical protein
MKRLIAAVLALFGLAATEGAARAWWCCCCCPPPPCIKWVETTVTCHKPTWHEREVTRTIMKPVPRTEMVKQTCTIKVPVWTDRTETCLVPRFVPRQVEREVVCCRVVPVCVTDPCTGCTITTWRPETYTRKEICTVMDCVPVRKDYTVKVCNYRLEQKTYEVPYVHCEWQPQTITCKERYCVMVPVQTKVLVPVCCP